MKLPRDFIIGVLSSIAGTLIVTGIGILSTLAAHTEHDQGNLQAVLLWLYAVLLIGAVYILASKRTSQLDSRTRIPRFGWRTKVPTSIGLAVATTSLIWAFLPCSIPSLKIQIRNHGQYGVLFRDEAAFYIVMPESPMSQAIVDRGLCSLSWFPTPQQRTKPLVVMRDETAEFRCGILSPRAYRSYLEAQNLDLQLLLAKSNGDTMSAIIHFSKHSVQDHWLIFDIGQ